MLKPGGEVAFLFIVDSCYHNFMVALLKVEKFKSMYKGPFNPNMYSEGRRSQYYKQMLEEIGFRNVVAKEIEKKYPHPSDEEWKDSLYEGYKNVFNIPPERVDEIKEEAFQIYVSRIERYEGNPCYSVLLLCLFGLKKKVETTVL
ncbi:uncharacterized protein NPIL_320671 [Nephila pilipes]|uniref:Uncharacterized protein n=1 Tax=Nephila pilipes TaxID=299642 RepID=A0A8X6P6B8_NEPPI|nr:uncharacterized protein NPIL_320671 [Nephila pilipes]